MIGKKYKKVESFKYSYLGSVMTSYDINMEIKSKLAAGNKCYCALGPILKRRSISQSIKIRLYKAIIRPAVIYGAEGWTVTDRNGKMLMTWGRKILREIYGPTEGNGQWGVKADSELMTKYKSQDTVSAIKIGRLEWLGHVIGMNEARIVKTIFEENLERKKR
jgi:hypothetical protein